jgi:[ribosomal protein S18]-alanine N-acetyltransferase
MPVRESDGLTIRHMAPPDVAVVADIEAASFSDAWPPSAFTDLLHRDYARLRVIADPHELVLGYCILLRAADQGEIANICTAPTARGQGIGGRLLDDALAWADSSGVTEVYLEVRTSNSAARALYTARGFSMVGRRRGYYQHPTEDALVLRRTVAGAADASAL